MHRRGCCSGCDYSAVSDLTSGWLKLVTTLPKASACRARRKLTYQQIQKDFKPAFGMTITMASLSRYYQNPSLEIFGSDHDAAEELSTSNWLFGFKYLRLFQPSVS